MEDRVAAIRRGAAPELIWLLEHPPLYTAGTSADEAELLDPGRLPVFRTGRGGRFTYHGPGQRVAYVMLDLRRRDIDPHRYVRGLEAWIIAALGDFGVQGERRKGRVGIWVAQNGVEEKIGAIGVRIRHGVSFHGVCVNVRPALAHYLGIVPCGIRDHGVTSLAALGRDATLADLDHALARHFPAVFPEPAEAARIGRIPA
jgi:lipoyl(octanoyl) transferase